MNRKRLGAQRAPMAGIFRTKGKIMQSVEEVEQGTGSNERKRRGSELIFMMLELVRH